MDRKRRTTVILFSVLALGLLACAQIDEPAPTTTSTDTQSNSLVGDFSQAAVSGDMRVEMANLVGQISDVTLTHYATEVTSTVEGTRGEITVIADTGAGFGMAMIQIADVTVLHEADGAHGITVVACSGGESGVWDFDGNAQNLDIDITRDAENPNLLTLEFSGEIVVADAFFRPDEDGYALASDEEIAAIPITTLSGSVTFLAPTPKE